jgi:hypothetical protein
MAKRRDPLPNFIPQWIQRRVEVDNYRLYEFMEQVGRSLGTEAWVLDAGAGEGKYRPELAHTHYVGADMAVGDVQWDYGDLDVVCDLVRLPFGQNRFQKPHDYYRYTSFGLRYLLERAGFNVESIQPMGGYFWFLSFQLQNINYWLFPRGMRGRAWTWPLRVLFGLLFQLILPLILFYLDRLDRMKDETFGYLCVAVKPK